MVDLERLRHLLSYDPETGIFVRRVSTGSRGRAGDVAGYIDPSHGYRSIGIDGREYYAHRLAWFYVTGAWPEDEIDHRNLDRSDNRFANLREASRAKNTRNRGKHPNNTSGVKGVTWHKKGKKWMAQIAVGKTYHYLGLFSSIEEAAAAYRDASWRLHGNFGRPA